MQMIIQHSRNVVQTCSQQFTTDKWGKTTHKTVADIVWRYAQRERCKTRNFVGTSCNNINHEGNVPQFSLDRPMIDIAQKGCQRMIYSESHKRSFK